MQEFLGLAHQLADVARPIALKYFRAAGLGFDRKPDNTPVTIADREIEAAMRRILSAARPDDGIFGEEEGHSNPDAEYHWILDPIDGTKAFTVGRPNFGVLIALYHKTDGIVLGLCDLPATNDRWWTAGGQTIWNGKAVTTRQARSLDVAVFACTDPLRLPPRAMTLVQQIRKEVTMTTYGGDCMNYALLASGFIDVIVEGRQALYDIAPFVPLINNAGGVITQLNGKPIGFHNDELVLCASSAELHAQVLEMYRALKTEAA